MKKLKHPFSPYSCLQFPNLVCSSKDKSPQFPELSPSGGCLNPHHTPCGPDGNLRSNICTDRARSSPGSYTPRWGRAGPEGWSLLLLRVFLKCKTRVSYRLLLPFPPPPFETFVSTMYDGLIKKLFLKNK